MLVWILVGGTDYFHLPALCWVMFLSILFWILTVSLFIIYLTGVHNRIPQVPWTTLVTHRHMQILHKQAALLFLLKTIFPEFCKLVLKPVILCLCLYQSLCINCIATALYLVTAVVDALSVNQDVRGRHNYNCWAASAVRAPTIFLKTKKKERIAESYKCSISTNTATVASMEIIGLMSCFVLIRKNILLYLKC